MGGARSEVAARHHPRAAGGRQLGRSQHPPLLVGAGVAQRGVGPLREGAAPEQCMHAQAVATQLMIDLCGATLLPGTIDIGGRGRPPQRTIRLREQRVQSILGVPVAIERQAEILDRARLPQHARRGRPRRDRAGAAPRGRHPRGRPDRGGRPHRRPGAPAGHAAGPPRRRRAAHPRPARAPRSRGRAGRARACTRSSAGALPTRGCSTGC